MKIIPAIDLKDGKCVRLTKGKENTSVIFNKNPTEQAKIFEKIGCEKIHIVDLDAAFGKGKTNIESILSIRKNTTIDIQLGGGIKSEKDILFWLDAGINYTIIGSLAVTNLELVKKFSKKFPKKIYISLDHLNGKVMFSGWEKNSKIFSEDLIKNFNDSHIFGYIFTDVSRDGTMEGINIKKVQDLIAKTSKPCIFGGGISSESDLFKLSNLKEPNLEGAIIGKSFYLNKIDIKKINNIIK